MKEIIQELSISQENFVSPERRKVYMYEQYGASYTFIKLIYKYLHLKNSIDISNTSPTPMAQVTMLEKKWKDYDLQY